MKKKIVSIMLTIALAATSCLTAGAGSPGADVYMDEMETSHTALSQYAAAQGMVLLENENNALPISAEDGTPIALFGIGAVNTKYGGSGSGATSPRYTVNVLEGFQENGYDVTSLTYLNRLGNSETALTDSDLADASDADTAVYVVSRSYGEDDDRYAIKGDYYLTDTERANLEKIAEAFEKTIVVLNVPGVVSTQFFYEIEGIDAIVNMSQGGMEGGNALVQVLNGTHTPSGKLVDTWAVDYADYPTSEYFSTNDGDSYNEYYEEGIYIGYRYFDTFNVTPEYEFGYGLSYTDFDIEVDSVEADAEYVTVKATVTNTGDTYTGKEVVQVYYSAPEIDIEKPYQELIGYGKTNDLKPGQSEELVIQFKTTGMASYDEESASYIMEAGNYVIRVGNSSRNTEAAAVISLDNTKAAEVLSNQLDENNDTMELLSKEGIAPYSYDGEAQEIQNAVQLQLSAESITTEYNASEYDDEAVTTYIANDSSYVSAEDTFRAQFDYEEEVVRFSNINSKSANPYTLLDVYNETISIEEFVAQLSIETLATIVSGSSSNSPFQAEYAVDQVTPAGNITGSDTTKNYLYTYGLPALSYADGPAGISKTVTKTGEDGESYSARSTTWPIETLLAQTWDLNMIEEIGEAIGKELVAFNIEVWLAPAMNIHRDPFNGRNYEYYSEDPLITGLTAAFTINGVQTENPGVGVSIKHFAMNNHETRRSSSDSAATERTIREIYLKGYEIAVKASKPMSVMSSYNRINGTYAAENYDLLTDILRGEWGFDGFVMTDYVGRDSHGHSMHAGNDQIMNGTSLYSIYPIDIIRAAVMDVEPNFVIRNGSIIAAGAGSNTTPMYSDMVWTLTGAAGKKASENNGKGDNGTFSYTQTYTHEFTITSAGDTTYQIAFSDSEYNSAVEDQDGIEYVRYSITEGYVLNITGYHSENYLTLGDVQKSAINVLKAHMQSQGMNDLYGDAVDIRPYNEKYDDLTVYLSLERSLDGRGPIDPEVPKVPSEKYVLDYYIRYAQKLVGDGTVETMIRSAREAFNDALDNANKVMNNSNATEDQIKDAVIKLVWEIAKSEWTKGDADELQVLYDFCAGLDLSGYEDDDEMAVFLDALAAAEQLLNDRDNYFQNEIDEAYMNLNNTFLNLNVLKLDWTALHIALALANTIDANISLYVTVGKTEFYTAVQNAEGLLEEAAEEVTQENINTTVDELLEAIGNLKLKADKTLLNNLLVSAEEIVADGLAAYIEATVIVFQNAFQAAQEVSADDEISQDEQFVVTEAAVTLENAIANLKLNDGQDSGNNQSDSNNNGSDQNSNDGSDNKNGQSDDNNGAENSGDGSDKESEDESKISTEENDKNKNMKDSGSGSDSENNAGSNSGADEDGKEVTSGLGKTSSGKSSVKTGDTASAAAVILCLGLSLATLSIAVKRKRG